MSGDQLTISNEQRTIDLLLAICDGLQRHCRSLIVTILHIVHSQLHSIARSIYKINRQFRVGE